MRWGSVLDESLPEPVDPFDALGYKPNCLIVEAARNEGIVDPYLPTPCGECPQERFHAAGEYDVLYGGARGGGKTMALVMEAIRLAVAFPGIQVRFFRVSYPALAEHIFPLLARLDYARSVGGHWRASTYDVLFDNGSQIGFRYAETLAHTGIRQGGQYQALFIDEVALMDPAVSQRLREQLRSADRKIPVIGVRASANPGGIGHSTIRQLYIHPTEYGRQVVKDEGGRTRRFIPAKVDDNPHIDAGYKAELHAIPDPNRRAAMLDGNWDAMEGQFFEEWSPAHHVISPFKIPPHWVRWRAIDYGTAAPFCCLWLTQGMDREIYVYREAYGPGLTARQQAELIDRMSVETHPDGATTKEKIAFTVVDPSCWQTQGTGDNIANQYRLGGLTGLKPAMNARVAGWSKVRDYLRLKGPEQKPSLFVFSNCKNLIRTFPDAPHDEHDPEDIDTRCDDHALDALRYATMARAYTGKPPPKKPATPEEAFWEDMRQSRRKRQVPVGFS